MTESNTYGVLYFIPGFYGVIPPLLYSDVLEMIAAHGYVVLSTWPLSSGDEDIDFLADAHFKNIAYLKENLPRNIRNIADFDYMGLGCHSAGCGPTLNMARQQPEDFLGTLNLEPITFAIRFGVNFTLPSLNYGAELSRGNCSTPNLDFERFYNEWECPRILMEAATVGHCDLLNDAFRASCEQLCNTSDDDLEAYRQFIAGLSAAFLNTYIQGNMDMLDYVIDPSKVNFPLLQLESDLECAATDDF